MKITASYINSKYSAKETIDKLDATPNIVAIHADLMDGKYVENKNFEVTELLNLFKNIRKEIDIHLMVNNPEIYLQDLFKINSHIIFFHPSASDNPRDFIVKVKANNRKVGIVINPNEEIKDFLEYFPEIDAILIMSVMPGKGGQVFLRNSLVKYELVKKEREKYNFEIYVDGGINSETISFVKDADAIIAGSYICTYDNYEEQAEKLLLSIT